MSHDELVQVASDHIEGLKGAWQSASQADEGIPADYQRLDAITKALIASIHNLRGGRILDIGCNSGLHTLMAGIVAESVVGCDLNKTYISRAQAGKAYLSQQGLPVENVSFLESDFPALLKGDAVDTLIAARVLYHLGDEKVELLKRFITRNVTRILIQARPMRDVVYANHPKYGVSVTQIYGGLYKVEDCIRFVTDCGFDNVEVKSLQVMWKGGESFPVIFASKREK